jgi:hypothetical protein
MTRNWCRSSWPTLDEGLAVGAVAGRVVEAPGHALARDAVALQVAQVPGDAAAAGLRQLHDPCLDRDPALAESGIAVPHHAGSTAAAPDARAAKRAACTAEATGASDLAQDLVAEGRAHASAARLAQSRREVVVAHVGSRRSVDRPRQMRKPTHVQANSDNIASAQTDLPSLRPQRSKQVGDAFSESDQSHRPTQTAVSFILRALHSLLALHRPTLSLESSLNTHLRSGALHEAGEGR